MSCLSCSVRLFSSFTLSIVLQSSAGVIVGALIVVLGVLVAGAFYLCFRAGHELYLALEGIGLVVLYLALGGEDNWVAEMGDVGGLSGDAGF